MVTHQPPIVAISVRISDDGSRLKDTAHNIRSLKEFTVNIISEPFVENADFTSPNAPADVSKWPVSDLTREPSVRHFPLALAS